MYVYVQVYTILVHSIKLSQYENIRAHGWLYAEDTLKRYKLIIR